MVRLLSVKRNTRVHGLKSSQADCDAAAVVEFDQNVVYVSTSSSHAINTLLPSVLQRLDPRDMKLSS